MRAKSSEQVIAVSNG